MINCPAMSALDLPRAVSRRIEASRSVRAARSSPSGFDQPCHRIDYLPDRAGQLLVQQNPPGPIVPWSALGVTALWAMAALLAGWFAINRRDA
jgi:hypothetical protein